MTVSLLQLVCYGLTVLVVAGLPIGLVIWYRLKCGQGFKPVITGAACFLVGSVLLERLLHMAVFSLFPTLVYNTAAYVAYGALAAGVFEEVARYVGLSLLCKNERPNLNTGLGYGIGHGGVEALVIVAPYCINNFIVVLQLFLGNGEALLASVPAENQALAAQQLQAVAATSPLEMLVPGIERLITIIFHIVLSILVWMVVTGRLKKLWLLGAILLHAAADVGAVLYQRGILSIWAAELYMAVFVLLVCWLVLQLLRKTRPQRNEE